jgi:hypothetical protein
MDIKLDLCTVLGCMKNILTSLIFCFSCLLVNAQQSHFIYLQTENKQPFFVKLDNKILNSYPLGYLIIPKLDDGLYSLVIGFPETNYEEEFSCSIKNKDVGFIIKNAGEKQWQLLNIQTFAVIIPGEVATKPVTVYEKETDPFSTMLANVIHDSTILRKDVSKEFPVEKNKEQNQKDSATNVVATIDVTTSKPDNMLASDSAKKDIAKEILPEKPTGIIQKDTVKDVVTNADVSITKPDNVIISDSSKYIAKEIIPEKPMEKKQVNTSDSVDTTRDVWISKLDKTETAKTEEINEPKDSAQNINPNSNVVVLRSVIKRKLKKSNKDGIEMMYVDEYGEIKDTIRVFIPSDKKKQNDEEKITEQVVTTPVTQSENQPITQPEKQPFTQPENKQNISDKPDNKISSSEKEVTKPTVKEPVFITSPMINSDCKNFATDDDFLKMRKKMVAENNDEDMVKVAKKIFKTRCFTTEQIKNLSVLFLKDEGKYMFFDAAYPFASDTDQYYILEKQLSDAYYITRFKAMIRK